MPRYDTPEDDEDVIVIDSPRRTRSTTRAISKPISITRNGTVREFAIKDVGGDGDCLFRAISHQLYNTPDYHTQIRSYIAKILLVLKPEVDRDNSFVDSYRVETFQQHIERIQKPRQWGDEWEIYAAERLYDIPIAVLQYNTENKAVIIRNPTREKKEPFLYLWYANKNHYQSLISLVSKQSYFYTETSPKIVPDGALENQRLRAIRKEMERYALKTEINNTEQIQNEANELEALGMCVLLLSL